MVLENARLDEVFTGVRPYRRGNARPDKWISVMFTSTDIERLEEAALSLGISRSEWVRRGILALLAAEERRQAVTGTGESQERP